MNGEKKGAAPATKAHHARVLSGLTEEYLRKEQTDIARTKARLVLELGTESVLDEDGTLLYDGCTPRPLQAEGFPDTVNPYLWQSRKNDTFKGILQLAEDYFVAFGIDICEIGFIRSAHGWIIIDTGNFVESAALARRLVELAIGENVRDHIQAVVISHTHPDHYAGIRAFVREGEEVPIFAPGGYEQSLIDDNLYAGVAMARRLEYQGGMLLRDPAPTGGAGVGYPGGLRMRGHQSFLFPNHLLNEDQTLTVDGVELDFFLTPNTETRAHMGVYSRKHKVLFLGDNAMGTLHNVYTPRGARVRDANYWGTVFYRLYTAYGDEVQAIWQGHGCPMVAEEADGIGSTFSNENLKTYLLDHAAAYKYTNDQALLLANKGYTLDQIGNELKIPDEISKQWYVRPHYGEYSFNARGTYARYLGFYDGNPVNLHPLGKAEAAEKLVEYIGSEELVLEKAKADFENGEYQWVAQITNALVFRNPANLQARYLCADALEQLGYQAENGVQRNAYLTGAQELRHPPVPGEHRELRYMDNRLIMPYVAPKLLLDYLGVNFDGEKAIHLQTAFCLQVSFTGSDGQETMEYHRVRIYKGTVLHVQVRPEDVRTEELQIRLTKEELYDLTVKAYQPDEERLGTRAADVLRTIEEYVVDTSRYQDFAIIEPLLEK